MYIHTGTQKRVHTHKHTLSLSGSLPQVKEGHVGTGPQGEGHGASHNGCDRGVSGVEAPQGDGVSAQGEGERATAEVCAQAGLHSGTSGNEAAVPCPSDEAVVIGRDQEQSFSSRRVQGKGEGGVVLEGVSRVGVDRVRNRALESGQLRESEGGQGAGEGQGGEDGVCKGRQEPEEGRGGEDGVCEEGQEAEEGQGEEDEEVDEKLVDGTQLCLCASAISFAHPVTGERALHSQKLRKKVVKV